MPLFQWDSSYSVQVADMDTEHQKLFDILNKLYDALKAGKAKDVMDSVFYDLVEYTKVHFSDEEKIMKKYNYPELSGQLEQHRAFEKKIQEQYDRFKSGASFVGIDVMSMLKDWLLNHISKFDKKYGQFFIENNIKLA